MQNRLFRYIVCFLCWLLPNWAVAQQVRQTVERDVLVDCDSILLDSLPVIQMSLEVLLPGGVSLDNGFSVSSGIPTFLIPDASMLGKTLKLRYQRINIAALNSKDEFVSVRKLDSVYRDTLQALVVQTKRQAREHPLIGLNSTGFYSRGITFGNNQDLVLNSSLNLQLNGALSRKLNIRAAVSDYSIPLQADGSTAQLSEIDRIFMEVYTDRHSIIAGDFSLQDSTSFLRVNKKWQGLQYKGKTLFGKKWTLTQRSAFALSKGVFHRVQFRGTESNQGPYRLLGKNGELAIVVLSGSERVYINGDLMKRGANADYTVDYNTAEITFTHNRPITKDSRIVIEYEYTNRQYLRYSVFNQTVLSSANSSFFIRYLGEFDDKLSPLLTEFTDAEKEVLKNAGNDASLMVVPSAKESEFSNEKVLYLKKDSLVDGTLFRDVYVRNYDPESQSYELVFTYVGDQQGDYVTTNTNENGRVYKWVAPVNGMRQGDYSAQKLLGSAQRQQMLVAGFSTFAHRLNFDLTYTNLDANTFSSVDDGYNDGVGVKLFFTDSLALKDSADYFKYRIDYEFTDRNFSVFERFREVEFSRNWGLQLDGQEFHGHLASARIDWKKNGSLLMIRPAYLRSDTGSLAAYRFSVDWHFRRGNWKIRSENNLADNQSAVQERFFIKSINRVEHIGKHWHWGTLVKYKRREEDATSEDNSGFQFVDYNAYVSFVATDKSSLRLQLGQRHDFIPAKNGFRLEERADEIVVSAKLAKRKNNFSLRSGLRRIRNDIADDAFRLTSQVKYNWKWWKGMLVGAVFYETNTGLEPKREYQYVKVSKGQGQYKWVDYNENGIQELDEFELAVFQDEGEYVRLWTPTQEYGEVRVNRINSTLSFRPRFKTKKKFGRFVNQTNYRVNYTNTSKYTGLDWYEVLQNPLYSNNTVLANARFSAQANWRKRSAGWAVSAIFRNNQNLILTANGRDETRSDSYSLRLSKRFGAFQWANTATFMQNEFCSEGFSSRNFLLEKLQNKSELIWNGGAKAKFNLGYRFADKHNISGEEKLQMHQTTLTADWKLPKAMLLRALAGFVWVDFNPLENSPVTTHLLEGFSTGKNFLTKIQFNRRFGKFLEINLLYEARFTEHGNPVQTGNMQVKAVF